MGHSLKDIKGLRLSDALISPKSSLFMRMFAITALSICILFFIMYLLSVPFIQQTVEKKEKDADLIALNSVHDMVEQAYEDIEDFRSVSIIERKDQLRNIIAVAETRTNKLEQAVRKGELTKESAKEILLDEFRQIKYGKDDYIWISDYHSTLISHPDPRINGADFSEVRDLQNELIVPPIVAGALKTGDGFHSYLWRRLGEDRQIEKLSYYKNIPFFSMVLSTGVYLDDIEASVERKKTRTIERLRNHLRTVHLAESGYVFIFDGQLKMIIHPNSKLESTDISNQLNLSTVTTLGRGLMSVADKQEGLHYLWDRPPDIGNYVYPKISWVRYSKGFDWYICSSVYVDELDKSANALRNRVVAVFAVTLFTAVLLVYFLFKRIAEPLRKLSDTASRVKLGDLSSRCNLNRTDEIGVVATAFNDMIGRLQENIINLDAKVAERTTELENKVELIQKQMLELKIQKEYIEKIYNLIPEGLVTIDKEKQFISCNHSYSRIISFWANMLDQSEAEMRELIQTELVNNVYKMPDGQCVLTIDQQPIHIEYASTVISNFHNIDRLISVRDVTKLKVMERQLMQSQKLEAVGRLASGIAHEINTPAQYVLTNNNFISDSWPDIVSVMSTLEALQEDKNIPQKSEWEALSSCFEQAEWDYLKVELPKAISDSTEGLRRIVGIVSAMRNFSHPSGDCKSKGDINKALKTTVEVARNEWKYHADIRFDLADNLPMIPCFLDQLNQVFLNMIVNSTHAIEEKQGGKSEFKGIITITSATSDTGNQIIVTIGDNGAGMHKSVKEKVFDPFFTTKQVNKGTGQGLAIAHDVIVNRHQGQIAVDSEMGVGTTFSIYLPLDQSD